MSSAIASTGSPVRRTMAPKNNSAENAPYDDDKTPVRNDSRLALKKSATALSTSKLANQAPKKMKTAHIGKGDVVEDANPMDKLLAKLSQQQATLNKQRSELGKQDRNPSAKVIESKTSTPSSSLPITPATESFEDRNASTGSPASLNTSVETPMSVDEVLRLKIELDRAKGQIALMDEELTQTRMTNTTLAQASGTASQVDFGSSIPNDITSNYLDNGLLNSGRPSLSRDNSWQVQEDARSDTSDALSAGGFYRARAIWGNRQQYNAGSTGLPPMSQFAPGPPNVPVYQGSPWMGDRGFGSPHTGSIPNAYGTSLLPNRLSPDRDLMLGGEDRRNQVRDNGRIGNRGQFQYGSSNSSYDNLAATNYSAGSGTGYNGGVIGYQPQSIGTPLSPFAPEFTAPANGGWKIEETNDNQTYVPTTEPLNYRRLLDRTVNCNWKYIVDKIVCSNDQQASIFLQQKLKVGTTEQKYDIVEAIVAQAYPLMVNRFGNFLVQRCFEHGTPEQVIKIAEAIRGNTLNLSMDAFGCHVVQKAFDSVPENYKAIMVHELLRRIPETVIHRYACHVWQKLFELRWTESPPQIMKYVNDALRGMWHEVALGETGSLVVQNIFENCLEEDKRPCIEEVLESIDVVAHGQFGNWCIQHICEHGAPADRGRAIDHVIRYATEYSMDQFASKVVEKCLKIGGSEFLHRYLDRVCEGRMDRPRIPLIDISSDQYGNYLIQYILTHSNPQDKEMVACHIRKHMVSLRGSKFGSRVGMLCNNPASATRPGPGLGSSVAPRMPPQAGPRYPTPYR